VVVVYAGFGNVEGLAVGLDGFPEAGAGGRLGDGLQSGDGLVISEDCDRGALLNELDVVVEVFAELGEGAGVGHGFLVKYYLLPYQQSTNLLN
jgi:hypothetical protein